MCGISGYFGSLKNQPSDNDLKKTLFIMKNRGKEACDFKKINVDNNRVINFLHSRISIFDPIPRSNQPFQAIKQDMPVRKCRLDKKCQSLTQSQPISNGRILLCLKTTQTKNLETSIPKLALCGAPTNPVRHFSTEQASQ